MEFQTDALGNVTATQDSANFKKVITFSPEGEDNFLNLELIDKTLGKSIFICLTANGVQISAGGNDNVSLFSDGRGLQGAIDFSNSESFDSLSYVQKSYVDAKIQEAISNL